MSANNKEAQAQAVISRMEKTKREEENRKALEGYMADISKPDTFTERSFA